MTKRHKTIDELAQYGAVEAYTAHGIQRICDAEMTYSFLSVTAAENEEPFPYPSRMPMDFEQAYNRYVEFIREVIATQVHNKMELGE